MNHEEKATGFFMPYSLFPQFIPNCMCTFKCSSIFKAYFPKSLKLFLLKYSYFHFY